MIEAGACESEKFRLNRALVLRRIGGKNLEIGRRAERKQAVARTLARMSSAISRRAIHSLGEMAFAIVEIGAEPDEMIDSHAQRSHGVLRKVYRGHVIHSR